MDLPKYQLSAENTLTVFEFTSIGPQGNIPKLIVFSETHLKDFYNLGFGDKDPSTGNINDKSVSNNGDSDKILATVVSAVYAFTDLHPNTWVYATGSTDARTRLYRIGISKHLSKATIDFEVYGLINDQWVAFSLDLDFEAFVVKRIKK